MNLNFGFVCDDARREENGKLLFIGAYGTNILLPTMPATIVLTLVLSVGTAELEEVEAGFQVLLNGKSLVSGKGRLKSNVAGTQFFPIRNILLQIPESGNLVFQLSLGGTPWQTACEIPVGVRMTST